MLAPPPSTVSGLVVGSYEVATVSDGSISLPIEITYPDAPLRQLKELLRAEGGTEEAWTVNCNVTLLKSKDRLILADVGSGSHFTPSAGELLSNLKTRGYDRADVTDIILTHGHPDHLWGISDNFDDLIFPDAQYHINIREWEFWKDEHTLTKINPLMQPFAVGAKRRFERLATDANTRLFRYGDEILPDVEAMDTSGHTPGHTSFAIHGGRDPLILAGDALTHVLISFFHPSWPTGTDFDPEKGILVRKKLLDRARTDGAIIVGFHLPGPGIGTVSTRNQVYQFDAL